MFVASCYVDCMTTVGDGTYDELPEREQVIVRAEWSQRIAQRHGLDFEGQLPGHEWPGLQLLFVTGCHASRRAGDR